MNKHVIMASGGGNASSDKISGKALPVWNGDGFFMRSDGRDYSPRRMKETVSGRCDAINWMTLLFEQLIDQTFEIGRQRRGFAR
ncbi:hypothetical protein [Bradyrhizobium sp. S3.5.5]|uniref:hypothetical protein n=1 Tax=Bradyrhizobium sp. S3.5.5 TaxID=3156430 RepID=UPI00339365CB